MKQLAIAAFVLTSVLNLDCSGHSKSSTRIPNRPSEAHREENPVSSSSVVDEAQTESESKDRKAQDTKETDHADILKTQGGSNSTANPLWVAAFRLYQNENLNFEGSYHQVAANASGQSLAVMRIQDTSNDKISYIAASYSPDGVNWQPEIRLDRDTAESLTPRRFAVAISPEGHGLAMWSQDKSESQSMLYAALFDPATKQWQDPILLAERGGYHFALAYDAADKRFWFAYSEATDGLSVALAINSIGPTANAPGTAQFLSSDSRVQYLTPVITMNQGKGALAYKKVNLNDGSPLAYEVIISFKNAGLVWSPPISASENGSNSPSHQQDASYKRAVPDLSVGISKLGETVVVWDVDHKGSNAGSFVNEIWAAVYGADGQKKRHQKLSQQGENNAHPLIQFNDDSDALIVWQHYADPSPNCTIEFTFYQHGAQSFSPSQSINGTFTNNQYAPDVIPFGGSDFILVFTEWNGKHYEAKSSLFASQTKKFNSSILISDPTETMDSNFPRLYKRPNNEISVLWRQIVPIKSNPTGVRTILGAQYRP